MGPPGSWGDVHMPRSPQPSISSVVTAPFPDDSQILLSLICLYLLSFILSLSCFTNTLPYRLSNHTKSPLPRLP